MWKELDVLLCITLAGVLHGTDQSIRDTAARLKKRLSKRVYKNTAEKYLLSQSPTTMLYETLHLSGVESITVGEAYRNRQCYDVILSSDDWDVQLSEETLVDGVGFHFTHLLPEGAPWIGIVLLPEYGFTGKLHTRWIGGWTPEKELEAARVQYQSTAT